MIENMNITNNGLGTVNVRENDSKLKHLNRRTKITIVAGIIVLVGSFIPWIMFSQDGSNYSENIIGVARSYPEALFVPILGIMIMLSPYVRLPIGSRLMGAIVVILPIEVLGRAGFIGYIGIGLILVIVGGFIALIFGLNKSNVKKKEKEV